MTDPVADIWVPLGGALLGAVSALVIAAVAIWFQLRDSRLRQANELYVQYLERCLERPDLADFSAFKAIHLRNKTALFNPYVYESKEIEEYQWFVGLMMVAMEDVLALKGRDTRWQAIVQDQIRFHRGYFDLTWAQVKHSCSPSLCIVVDNVRSEPL